MTGERRPEDEVVEPTADAGDEPLIADTDDDADASITPGDDTSATEADLETRDDVDVPPGAPFAEPRASERLTGSRRPAVVPESKARGIAAEDRKRGAVAGTPATGASPASDDELPHVDDRVSKLWVALIAGTFLLILLYGVIGGRGGLLDPQPTAAPSASPAPSLTAAPTTPPTARPSATPAGSASPAASPTAGGSPSAVPSASSAPATVAASPS